MCLNPASHNPRCATPIFSLTHARFSVGPEPTIRPIGVCSQPSPMGPKTDPLTADVFGMR